MNIALATEWVHKHAVRSRNRQTKWVCKKPHGYPGALYGPNKGALIIAVNKFSERVIAERWRRRIIDG